MDKPPFDPNQPFQTTAKPTFDPSQPFEPVKNDGGGFHLSDAVTDIPREVGRTADANLSQIEHLSGIAGRGPIEGLLDTGKAALAVPGLVLSPITGALKSLMGHPMAQAEHTLGGVLAPDIAAKDDPQAMYDTAAGDVETALSAGKPGKLAPPKVAAPAIPELKTSARAVWDSPAIKAIDVPPADAAALGAKIEADLIQRGFRPSAGSAPETFNEIRGLAPPQGVHAVKVDDLRGARRALNIQAAKRDPMTGQPTPEATAASQAIGHIDGFLDSLSPDLKSANADYAAAKGAERLDYRMAKAEHRAARSGTGGNLENVMRQEADKIPDRGLTAEEQAMRDRIVMGSALRNTLRTTGKLGVDGGLSLMLHAGAALGTGGTTVPVTVAGTMARKVGEMLTKREMANLSETIRSRAPLAQALKASAPTPQISHNTKALAAALMSRAQPRIYVGPSILPANADQSQK